MFFLLQKRRPVTEQPSKCHLLRKDCQECEKADVKTGSGKLRTSNINKVDVNNRNWKNRSSDSSGDNSNSNDHD